MLRDDFIALMGKRLGNRTDLDASILLEMVMVQEQILEGNGALLPWFLDTPLEQDLTLVAGTESIALPITFLAEIEEQKVWKYDASANPAYTNIPKGNYSVLKAKYPTPGVPRGYTLTEGYMLIQPVPDVNYALKWRYKARATSLSTGNIENSWLKWASDWMFAEVGAIMAGRYLHNAKLEQQFQDDRALARSRVLIMHEARLHNNRTYGMGED